MWHQLIKVRNSSEFSTKGEIFPGCAEHGRGRTLVHALRQELIQQLQALGFMPSAYSCESATPSRQPHRDLRVSVDAVAVSNDLHSLSRPQAILKVWHLRSLDYRPRHSGPALQP